MKIAPDQSSKTDQAIVLDTLDSNRPASEEAEAPQTSKVPATQNSQRFGQIRGALVEYQGLIEQRKLSEFGQSHIVMSAAVRRTPPEVWSAIFVQCLPTEISTLAEVTKAPILIGRVCRLWRTISISTPALWSSIYICHTPQRASKPSLPAIKIWLTRSGNLPLSISLNQNLSMVPSNELLNLLISLSVRWYHMCLSGPAALVKELLCNPGVSAPRLTVLEVIACQWQDDSVSFEFSPSLTSLRDVTCSTLSCPRLLHLPWAQLTGLRIGTTTHTEQCLYVAKMCPRLSSLSLNILSPSPSPSPPLGEMVCLSDLSYLSLAGFGHKRSSHAVGAFLDGLIIPNLR